MVRHSHSTRSDHTWQPPAAERTEEGAPSGDAALPRWQCVGRALSAFSPWALAFCLTAAYFTMGKPDWLAWNLSFCIAMPVIMLARLAWVLFGPDDTQA